MWGEWGEGVRRGCATRYLMRKGLAGRCCVVTFPFVKDKVPVRDWQLAGERARAGPLARATLPGPLVWEGGRASLSSLLSPHSQTAPTLTLLLRGSTTANQPGVFRVRPDCDYSSGKWIIWCGVWSCLAVFNATLSSQHTAQPVSQQTTHTDSQLLDDNLKPVSW